MAAGFRVPVGPSRPAGTELVLRRRHGRLAERKPAVVWRNEPVCERPEPMRHERFRRAQQQELILEHAARERHGA